MTWSFRSHRARPAIQQWHGGHPWTQRRPSRRLDGKRSSSISACGVAVHPAPPASPCRPCQGSWQPRTPSRYPSSVPPLCRAGPQPSHVGHHGWCRLWWLRWAQAAAWHAGEDFGSGEEPRRWRNGRQAVRWRHWQRWRWWVTGAGTLGSLPYNAAVVTQIVVCGCLPPSSLVHRHDVHRQHTDGSGGGGSAGQLSEAF